MSLGKIAYIENQALEAVVKDIEQYPKYRDIIKQKKQVAGMLEPDNAPKHQTINIKGIKELSIHLQQKRIEQTAEQVQEAEIVNNEG